MQKLRFDDQHCLLLFSTGREKAKTKDLDRQRMVDAFSSENTVVSLRFEAIQSLSTVKYQPNSCENLANDAKLY